MARNDLDESCQSPYDSIIASADRRFDRDTSREPTAHPVTPLNPHGTVKNRTRRSWSAVYWTCCDVWGRTCQRPIDVEHVTIETMCVAEAES